jgi:hypothetical protein
MPGRSDLTDALAWVAIGFVVVLTLSSIAYLASLVWA